MKMKAMLLWVLIVAVFCTGAAGAEKFVRPAGVPTDVLPEYNNEAVTALSEDCESVRLALGAGWDDAMAGRAFSGYLRPWSADDSRDAAETMVKRGTAMYELVKCIDDGIQSVRLARDSRDEPVRHRGCGRSSPLNSQPPPASARSPASLCPA